VRANVENAVNQLQSNLEPVLAEWRGQAADVFRKLTEQYRENAKVITDKLGEISENIQSSGQEYLQQQEETAQEISKIENLLNG
ncbi:WXG100 family type VII secretion target, partial [Klebsiella pneumoniae]|nr:WXG100 family type VII secretion target [Klebsiella pneumoniae]